ncbi:MAG: YceI family protein [Dissulfurispiraceae bacterium]
MSKWIIDPDHSVAAFVVKHMMVTNVHGQVNKLAGRIYFDPSNAGLSLAEVTIEANGIYTGIKKRDDHLRSPDFFDAANFPYIIFKSTKVDASSGKSFDVIGDLTIRGITQRVALQAEYAGPVKSTDGDTTIGFTATTRINREDYNIMWNEMLEGNGIMVGKEVMINLAIEADLASD